MIIADKLHLSRLIMSILEADQWLAENRGQLLDHRAFPRTGGAIEKDGAFAADDGITPDIDGLFLWSQDNKTPSTLAITVVLNLQVGNAVGFGCALTTPSGSDSVHSVLAPCSAHSQTVAVYDPAAAFSLPRCVLATPLTPAPALCLDKLSSFHLWRKPASRSELEEKPHCPNRPQDRDHYRHDCGDNDHNMKEQVKQEVQANNKDEDRDHVMP